MSLPPSRMSSPRASRRRTPFSLSDLRWKPISLPRDDSQWDRVSAPALVCMLSEVDVAIISLCVCFFFLLPLFVTLYIFLHLTAMYSSTFGKGWVGRSCLYFLVWVSFGSFSLRELTCMHCVYLALWTCKVLCGSFFMRYIKNFIHSSLLPFQERALQLVESKFHLLMEKAGVSQTELCQQAFIWKVTASPQGSWEKF